MVNVTMLADGRRTWNYCFGVGRLTVDAMTELGHDISTVTAPVLSITPRATNLCLWYWMEACAGCCWAHVSSSTALFTALALTT
jgi:hypothetical protein